MQLSRLGQPWICRALKIAFFFIILSLLSWQHKYVKTTHCVVWFYYWKQEMPCFGENHLYSQSSHQILWFLLHQQPFNVKIFFIICTHGLWFVAVPGLAVKIKKWARTTNSHASCPSICQRTLQRIWPLTSACLDSAQLPPHTSFTDFCFL